MANAAEQMARNLNFGTFAKAKDLQARILFTLGILVLYRLGTFIPLPGLDPSQYAALFESQANGILGSMNLFAGGAVERMGIFALNVMPYITASIIVQMMTTASPTLEKLKKEGEAGRKQLNQYTRYLTLVFALVQSFAIAGGLAAVRLEGISSWFFILTGVVTLTGGTMMLMWMGEQITARGIGNGISLIIFAGIVAELPRAIYNLVAQARTTSVDIGFVLAIAFMVIALIVFIVFIERSQRRLIIHYPKRQQSQGFAQGQRSFLPLKINTAGVIPPIFASSLLLLPATAAGFIKPETLPAWAQWLPEVTRQLQHGQPMFMLVYGALIVFFCFFYTSIVFNPEDTAENLRKYGGFLPGIRPGKRTAEYLDYVLSRLTVIGAGYITAVCLVPELLVGFSGAPNAARALGGTSILIVVSVTMDTVAQIQSHLLAHQYEGLIKKSKLRGGRR
jgi:preprotein translocase subunit SecY